ncbi:MAG: hypothetical protein SGARI_000355, partial [Bacillariaceae sp.]
STEKTRVPPRSTRKKAARVSPEYFAAKMKKFRRRMARADARLEEKNKLQQSSGVSEEKKRKLQSSHGGGGGSVPEKRQKQQELHASSKKPPPVKKKKLAKYPAESEGKIKLSFPRDVGSDAGKLPKKLEPMESIKQLPFTKEILVEYPIIDKHKEMKRPLEEAKADTRKSYSRKSEMCYLGIKTRVKPEHVVEVTIKILQELMKDYGNKLTETPLDDLTTRCGYKSPRGDRMADSMKLLKLRGLVEKTKDNTVKLTQKGIESGVADIEGLARTAGVDQ